MADNTVDSLVIEIEADAKQSVEGIKAMSKALSSMANSVKKINGAGLDRVSSQMKSFNVGTNQTTVSLSRATGGTHKFGNSLKSLSSNVGGAKDGMKSLAYHFGKFYANCFLAIRGIKALGKAVNGAMDYIEAFNFYDVAIGSATEKTDEWKELGYRSAEAYATAFKQGLGDLNEKMTGFSVDVNSGDIKPSGMPNLGIDITQLETFEAEIVSVTSSLGLATKTSYDASKALSMLTADMSSLKNIDLKTVMQNFQSGIIGQSRALYKFGIDITAATLSTYAYKYGITKAVSEMTQAEKMQLRLLAILDQSKVAWGDLANTINQPANQLRVFTSGVKNLAITIGKLLLPIVSAVLPYLNAMVKALQTFFTWIANVAGIKLDAGNTGSGTSDFFDDIADSADNASNSVGNLTDKAKELNKQLAGFDELNNLTTSSSSGSGNSGGSGSSGSGIDLSDEISKALANYESAWNEAYKNMKDKSTEMAQAIVDAFRRQDYNGIGTYVSKGITKALKKIKWNSVYEVADKFGEGLAEFLNGLLTPELFSTVGETFAGCVNTVIHAGLSFVETFDWKQLGDSLAAGINKCVSDINWADAGKLFGELLSGIITATNEWLTSTNWTKLGESIGTFIRNAFNSVDWAGLRALIGNLFGALIDTLSGITGINANALEALAAALGTLYAALKVYEGLKTVNTALASFQTAMGAVGLLDVSKMTLGFAGLGTTITALGPIALGVAAALGVVAKVFSDLYVSQGELEKIMGSSWGKIKEKIAQTKTEVESLNSTYEGLRTEYGKNVASAEQEYSTVNKLIDSYFNLRDKTNLTAEEKENLFNIAEKLIQTFPELQSCYDSTTGYIDASKESVKELNEELLKQDKIEASKTYLTSLYSTYYDSIKAMKDAYDEYTTAVAKADEAQAALNQVQHSGSKNEIPAYQAALNDAKKAVSDSMKTLDKAADTVDDTGESINGMTQDLYGLKENLSSADVANNEFNVGLSDTLTGLGHTSDALGKSSVDLNNFSDTARTSSSSTKQSLKDVTDSFGDLKKSSSDSSTSSKNSVKSFTDDTRNYLNDSRSQINKSSDAFSRMRDGISRNSSSASGSISSFTSNSGRNLSGLTNKSFSTQTSLDSLSSGASRMSTSASNSVSRMASNLSGDFAYTSVYAKYTKSDINDVSSSTANLMRNSGQTFTVNTSTSALDTLANSVFNVVYWFRNLFSYNGKSISVKSSGSGRASISAYATGGMPNTGEFFLARENGIPEMVGSLGGKNTVANNDQIVAGISAGVANANSETNSLLREQNNLLMQLLAKDMGISARDVFNAVRQEDENYENMTGHSAFVR